MLNNKKISIVLAVMLSAGSLYADRTSSAQFVDVVSSEKIIEDVIKYTPTEVCEEVRESAKDGSGINDIVGAVIGGAAGGVLGHQVGGGRGKDIATVGGAVIGAIAGQKAASSYSSGQNDGSYNVVRKCHIEKMRSTEKTVTGYLNHAYVNGEKISKKSLQPLTQIRVNTVYEW